MESLLINTSDKYQHSGRTNNNISRKDNNRYQPYSRISSIHYRRPLSNEISRFLSDINNRDLYPFSIAPGYNQYDELAYPSKQYLPENCVNAAELELYPTPTIPESLSLMQKRHLPTPCEYHNTSNTLVLPSIPVFKESFTQGLLEDQLARYDEVADVPEADMYPTPTIPHFPDAEFNDLLRSLADPQVFSSFDVDYPPTTTVKSKDTMQEFEPTTNHNLEVTEDIHQPAATNVILPASLLHPGQKPTLASCKVSTPNPKEETRKHRCVFCSKKFKTSSTLTVHLRIHTNKRPYNCEVCSRSFTDFSTYTKHKRVHSQVKPYSCDVCSKSFSQSGNLNRHKKTFKH